MMVRRPMPRGGARSGAATSAALTARGLTV
jgi:hypothetical protein